MDYSQENENAEQRMIHSLEKKVYDLRNLIEVAMSLSSNLDFQNLVESIMFSCIGQMFVEKVALLLTVDIDINNFFVHSYKGYDRRFTAADLVLTQDSPLVHFLDQHPFPYDIQTLRKETDLSCCLNTLDLLEPELVIPLKSKNSLNGILILGPKIHGGGFSADEREFLKGLARFAAIAVENSRLYLMATMDRMTRLYIHHYFQERLAEEIKRSERYSKPLCILISDIDHFKIFNDTYGHQQGDIVLKEAARIVKDTVRKIDIPARYGGEEFSVILPETDLESATAVASRIRKRIEECKFPGQSEPLHVTVSIGVAQYDPERDKDKKDLIERADKSLYKAKNSGRNCVVAFK
ncbi:MAG: diguanylate cyclase [Spirochaetota bacterium]